MLREELEISKNESSEIFSMKYLDTILNIYTKDEIPIFKQILNFFSTHFEYQSFKSESSIANIIVRKYDDFRNYLERYLPTNGVTYAVRESTAEKFNLQAVFYSIDTIDIYKYVGIDTVIFMDKDNQNIYLYISELSEIAIIEFIRDIVIKDQENRGTMILHAAAVEKDGEAIVISGAKGAGKSTTMLELAIRHGYKIISGDKIFLIVRDGQLFVKGWPDYPHIGVGTIKKYKELCNLLDPEQLAKLSDKDKILISPALFYGLKSIGFCNRLCNLKLIIFPNFTTAEEQTILYEYKEYLNDLINNLEFKDDYSVSKWHQYICVNSNNKQSTIEKFKKVANKCKAYRLVGNINLTLNLLSQITK